MHDAGHGSDATIEWMTADVARRCEAVLTILRSGRRSAVRLGDAAILLRGAADDLGSVVELVEGPRAAVRAESSLAAFGLAFGMLDGSIGQDDQATHDDQADQAG